MKKKKCVLLFILFIILLTSCKKNIRPYFENSSCSLPCWNGITPGQTGVEEAKRILMEDLELQDVGVGDASWGENGYTIHTDFDRKQGLEIYIQNSTVTAIWITDTNLIGLNMSVQDVIDLYGYPESIYVTQYSGWSFYGYQINLFYPSNSMVILVRNGSSDGCINIDKNTSISGVILMPEEEYMEFMISYVDDFGYFDFSKTSPWEGYKKYCSSDEQ